MAFSNPSIASFPSDLPTQVLQRISYAGLKDKNSTETEKLCNACKTDGFFLLDLTDSEQGRKFIAIVDDMFMIQDRFFKLDHDIKMKYVGERFLGYKPEGAAKGDLQGRPDRCEMWTTQKEDILNTIKPNPAPSVMSSHRKVQEAFVRGAHAIEDLVLGQLEHSLQMQPGSLTAMHHIDKDTRDQYRMICFPPLADLDRRSSMVPHRDFGSLTILFNILGGLQALPSGKDPETEENWLYIKPVPGCAIINIGDIMVAFTNGVLKSPMHRVVPPPGKQASLTRYSLAYFARPEKTTIVKRLDGGNIPHLREGDVEEELEASEWFAAKIKTISLP